MAHIIVFVICIATALGSMALGLGSLVIGSPEGPQGTRQSRQSKRYPG